MPRCRNRTCLSPSEARCHDQSRGDRDNRRLAPEIPSLAGDDRFYKRLIDNLYDAVYFVDSERRIAYWNRAAELLTGYAAAEVMGRRCSDNILVHTDNNGVELCRTACPLSATILDGLPRETDVYLRHKNGYRVSISVRVQPLVDLEGKTIGAVEVFSDNAVKREAEQKAAQLEKMAFLDCLTRIPNRRFMEMRLRQVLEKARRYGHRFCLILADIDHFKEINDRYGHSVGDSALIAVAQTLSRGLRTVDNVGRWGGDEFAVILPEVAEDGLRGLAERCCALVKQSQVTGMDSEAYVQLSMGGTLVRADDTAESAMGRVDQQLYESKRQGRGRVTIG